MEKYSGICQLFGQDLEQLLIVLCPEDSFAKPDVLEKTADFRKKLDVRAASIFRRKGHHKNLRRFVIKAFEIDFPFTYPYARNELTYGVGPGMRNGDAVLHPGGHFRFVPQNVLQRYLRIENFPGGTNEIQQRPDDLLFVPALEIGSNQFDRERFPYHAETIGRLTRAVKFSVSTIPKGVFPKGESSSEAAA